ncbi:unnamed protein product [Ectocarpus sp. CCAP 1310/34]|nr:unnamed protein product [Ectocarpus sp. CCAP 1310/34]
MLAANDLTPSHHKKRIYPEPDFVNERTGGKKGSYPMRFKLKAAAFTRVLCEDGQPLGNSGAAKLLGVDRRRIITWVGEEATMKKLGTSRLRKHGSHEQLLELKPDALGGLTTAASAEETLAFKTKFKNWHHRFRERRGVSIRRHTNVGQKLPTGYEGLAFATLMKLRTALLERAGEIYARRHPPAPDESPIKGKDLSPAQLESVAAEVFEELGNMDQTPVQQEMPVETTLEKRGAKDARISTGGKEKDRFTLCLAVMADGGKVPLQIIFKGKPFIPPSTAGRGRNTQPRKGSIAAESLPANRTKFGYPKDRFTLCLAVMADGGKVPLQIIFKGKPFIPPSTAGRGRNTQPRKGSIAAESLPANRTKFGYPVSGMSFGVQEKNWCDARECILWLSESWSILVLDDFRCHRSESFIEDLRRRTNTIVILIPGGLTPLFQPLDRMLNKEMKRLMRGRYTQYMASAIADPRRASFNRRGVCSCRRGARSHRQLSPPKPSRCASRCAASCLRSTVARTTRGAPTTW